MICPNCGKILEDEKNFCPSCGTPLTGNAENPTDSAEQSTAVQVDQPKVGKKKAIASLVWGILALLSCGAFIFPEILGVTSAKKGKENGKMRKAAKIGLICSILSIILLITGTTIGIFVLRSNSSGNDSIGDSSIISDEEPSVEDNSDTPDVDVSDNDMAIRLYTNQYTIFAENQSLKDNKNPANDFKEVASKVKKKQIKKDLLDKADYIYCLHGDENHEQLAVENIKIIDVSDERQGFLNTQKIEYITALITVQLPYAKYTEPVDLIYVYSHQKWHLYDISVDYGAFFDIVFPSKEELLDMCKKNLLESEQLWDISLEFDLATGHGLLYALLTDDNGYMSDPLYQDDTIWIKMHRYDFYSGYDGLHISSEDYNFYDITGTVASEYTHQIMYALSLEGYQAGEKSIGSPFAVLDDESDAIASCFSDCGVCSASAYFCPRTYEEVIVVSCQDPADCEKVRETLSMFAELRMENAEIEGNEYAKGLDEPLIDIKDNHVFLCISRDNQPAKNIIENYVPTVYTGFGLEIFSTLP